jgi:hypothetical protein
MKKTFIAYSGIALLTALGMLLWNAKSTFAFVVAQDGQAKATIVIAPDASARVKKAAQTLQQYIKESSGAELPIANSATTAAINIGVTDASRKAGIDAGQLDEDGFILQETMRSNISLSAAAIGALSLA